MCEGKQCKPASEWDGGAFEATLCVPGTRGMYIQAPAPAPFPGTAPRSTGPVTGYIPVLPFVLALLRLALMVCSPSFTPLQAEQRLGGKQPEDST